MISTDDEVYRFGRAVVDVARREVTNEGEPQHLEPQAFDLLVYLVSHGDRVVSKEELLDEIWGDQFVSESALTTRIKEIRRALGDDGVRQAVIKNFRGRGYRFVGALDEVASGGSAASTLIGRDEDVAALCGLLETARVVTLVGPGGVGKTTLAMEVASRRSGRFDSDVVFIDLTLVNDPEDVIHMLRRAADLDDTGPEESEVLAAVAALDAIVVVDNCEHVLAEVARLVAEIARNEGTARIVATSRERLGVSGEQVWPVLPLDEVTARQMLLARARAVQPDYEPHPDDEPHLAKLLAMLDRLPLAIEMAAARLPSMRPADLVDHLMERMDLIEAPTRETADRQRTLPALIGWSENLLDAETRDLLVQLSVFAGPVPVDDIAAVLGGSPAELALGPLAELVARSLAVVDTSGPKTRYRLLETVRSVLAPRRAVVVDECHARYYAGRVADIDQRLRTPDEAAAVTEIEGTVAELRAAHTWARHNDIDMAAEITASLLHYAHERQWAEPAVWAAPLAFERDAFAAAVAADLANRADYAQATLLAENAVGAADPRVRASALDTLANVGIYMGDLELSRDRSARLKALGDEIGDPTTKAFGLLGMTLAHLYGGELDEARYVLDGERPAALSRTALAWLEYADGEVLAAVGRERDAVERFDRAIALGGSVSASFVVSVARISALAARSRAGDVDEALAASAEVLAEYRRTRSLTHATTALRNLISLLTRVGCDEPAMVLIGALESPGTKSTYGVESERVAVARTGIESRHGADKVVSWLRRGAGNDVIWALDFAVETVESIC